MSRAIPILMYHQITPRVAPAFRKYAVTPKAFARQMKWLALAGYKTITLDQLVAYRAGQNNLPPRPVIITFDDGFQDCLKYAVPPMQKHGFNAIFYLVAGLSGNTSRWLVAERGMEYPLMDWPSIRQLVKEGFQIGSHTLTHPRLPALSSEICREELSQSRVILEDKLGQEIIHLAYPFGSYNKRVQAIAAEIGYRTSCSVRIGFSTADDDLLALHRVPILGQDFLIDFIYRLRSARAIGEVLPGRVGRVYQRLQNLGDLAL